MIVIVPKTVRVIKGTPSGVSTSATAKKATSKKKKATGKPSDKVIGMFYMYHKKPLNYLFSLLKKPRKTAEEKETITDIVKGLRKVEAKFQKEHDFTESVIDLLIEQRDLSLGRIKA